MTPEDLAFTHSFVATCRWQFAASVPEHPHEYCLRRWLPPERQADFDRFAALIAAHGDPGWFWGQRWVYLALSDGKKYWTSRELFRKGAILNRAAVEPDRRR